MTILDLPEEILAIIIQQIPSYRDHFALAGSCRFLHERVFPHVRKLDLADSTRFQRVIPYYTALRRLHIIGVIPSSESLRHLTSVRSLVCLPSYLRHSDDIRQSYNNLLPWILRQPLEDVFMDWNSYLLEDRASIFSLPTLRQIQGCLTTSDLLSVSPSVEKLSITVSGFIQFTHLTNLRELSIHTIEMTSRLIDELVKMTSLIRLNLDLKDIRLSADTPLATLPVYSLFLRQREISRDLSSLRHWKQLSHLSLPRVSTKQLAPLMSHPNKGRLYCQIHVDGLRSSHLITELYHLLLQSEMRE